MDSVMEKFDLLDFFNLIIAGAVFLIGLGFYDNDIQCHLHCIMCIGGMSTFSAVVIILLFVLLSYVAGAIFNAIGWIVDGNKYHNSLIEECLINPSIVGNSTKLDIYKKNAEDYFISEGIPFNAGQPSDEQCSCFFAHCVYFIQAKAQNQKAEKLRDIQGLSRVLMISFGALFFSAGIFVQDHIFVFTRLVLVCVFLLLRAKSVECSQKGNSKKGSGPDKKDNIENQKASKKECKEFCCKLRRVITIIVALIIVWTFLDFLLYSWKNSVYSQILTAVAAGLLAYLFCLKYRKDVRNRIRMIMAVYDVCKKKRRPTIIS